MVKNQLFRVLPDIEIVNSILETFGLTSLNDTKFFTKDTINKSCTIEKLNEMKDVLEKYYLPCKSMYIRDINEKRCIVILRQFIKVYGYTIISKERHIGGSKINVYRLIEDDKQSTPTKSKEKNPIVISFQ